MKARSSRTLAAMLPAGLASLALGLGALPAIASGGGAITTVAGGPGRGLARNVAQLPLAVATGRDGSVYLASGVVRSLSDASTWEKVVAGGGNQGLANDIPASRLALDAGGVAVGAAGNVIVADVSANRVIVVAATSGTFYGQAMTAGNVYVVAGSGARGYTGDGGPAAAAELDLPHGVAVDARGNLVIADYYNNAIRVVAATSGTFYGQAMTGGDIYTVAGEARVTVPREVIDVPGGHGLAEEGAGGHGGHPDLRAVVDRVISRCGRGQAAGLQRREGTEGIGVQSELGVEYLPAVSGELKAVSGDGVDVASGPAMAVERPCSDRQQPHPAVSRVRDDQVP